MIDSIIEMIRIPALSSVGSVLLNILDIFVVATVFYYVYVVISETKGFAVLQGVILVFLITFIARVLNLQTLYWLLEKVIGVSLIAVIILFQAEIKRALVMLGQRTLLRKLFTIETSNLYKIMNACYGLAKKECGALIVIQRNISLQAVLEKAVILDALISGEIIQTIFYGHNPLHDGALIINRNRIVAASAYLPLSESSGQNQYRRLGTRHRAGLGITEQSDAIAIIVSEETSAVSLAYAGRLDYNIGREEFGRKLETLLGVESERSKKE